MITEPALSYTAQFLKKRFDKCIICCIRFTDAFDRENTQWDKVFYAVRNNKNNTRLSEEIFSFMGEEGMCTCFFISWMPSEKAFPSAWRFSWDEIKKAGIRSRAVLDTRAYFSKRWLRNTLRFCAFTQNPILIKKRKQPCCRMRKRPEFKKMHS